MEILEFVAIFGLPQERLTHMSLKIVYVGMVCGLIVAHAGYHLEDGHLEVCAI